MESTFETISLKPPATRKALLISVSEFESPELLAHTEDVNDLSGILEHLSGVTPQRLLNEDATPDGIRDTIKALVCDLKPPAVVYVYLSTHGASDPTPAGGKDVSLAAYAKDSWFTLSSVLKWLHEGVEGLDFVVVVDACHSGPPPAPSQSPHQLYSDDTTLFMAADWDKQAFADLHKVLRLWLGTCGEPSTDTVVLGKFIQNLEQELADQAATAEPDARRSFGDDEVWRLHQRAVALSDELLKLDGGETSAPPAWKAKWFQVTSAVEGLRDQRMAACTASSSTPDDPLHNQNFQAYSRADSLVRRLTTWGALPLTSSRPYWRALTPPSGSSSPFPPSVNAADVALSYQSCVRQVLSIQDSVAQMDADLENVKRAEGTSSLVRKALDSMYGVIQRLARAYSPSLPSPIFSARSLKSLELFKALFCGVPMGAPHEPPASAGAGAGAGAGASAPAEE